MGTVARIVMWFSGALVVAAGVIHLVMTGHVMQLPMPTEGALGAITPAAMFINHAATGVLLLPLGAAFALVGPGLSRRDGVSGVIAAFSCAALLSLPVIVIAAIQPEMAQSPAFFIASAMLAAAGLLATLAALFLWTSGARHGARQCRSGDAIAAAEPGCID